MKKKNIKIVIIFICLLLLVVAGYAFVNEVLPKAPAIDIPDKEDIIMVSVGVNKDDEFEVKDIDIDKLLTLLGNAKPTREQSLDDYPTARVFYRFEIKTSETEHYYYIYEDSTEQVYIEIPYVGVYTAEKELFSFVLKYFEE